MVEQKKETPAEKPVKQEPAKSASPAPEPEYYDDTDPRELRPKRGCFGKLMAIIGILIVLAIIAAGVGYLEIRTRLMPVSSTPKEIVVTIPKGAHAMQIGRILEEAGAIRSADAFRRYVAFKKAGPKLKAGEQVLNASMNTPEVVQALIEGRFKLYPVTIPEGRTMKEIAGLVEKAGLARGDEFLKLCRDRAFIASLGLDAETLEGYLFPETYNFSRQATVKEIIKAMVDRFFKVWDKYANLAKGHELNRHEIVTLASIIEKETGAAEERPMIASVFLNRLKKGMRLETDPTVIYGIKDFDGNITKKHLQTPTPYNTYVIQGLPPGPIASPGEESIKAVLYPAPVDYLFFVSKNDGTHQFSKTLKEHNKAVNEYQRKRKSN